MLALHGVLHAPDVRCNLVSGALLNKLGLKLTFEADKVVLTKSNVFTGKGYNANVLFVLNVLEITNEKPSFSYVYIVESFDIWHGRGDRRMHLMLNDYVNLGLIKNHISPSIEKCHTCVEAKL